MTELQRAEIDIGEEFENFVTTTIGKYLIACAEQERTFALEELSKANVNDSDNLRELQMKAQIPVYFQAWLSEAIESGIQAKFELQQGEQN